MPKKVLNEALEMLAALVELHNEGETINKITWNDARKIVARNKEDLVKY